ncbi:phosphotransferase [Citricoccus sp. GCM10030269]|uniref:phosphotransferase n=1 Tax=Citricoccus sp. GCM10030269 TaxID=3273388 RepID=UPI00362385CE
MPWELRDGEPVITTDLVRALLTEQHPDLATLPIGTSVRGWDNTMVRLGDDLALRLPRHQQAEELLDREVTWLPVLAAQLASLPVGARASRPDIPTPVRSGAPGAGYPFRWAIVPWLEGAPAALASAEARDEYAELLAKTLRRLHQPAPAEAPASAFRGIDIRTVADRFEQRWVTVAPDLSSQRQAELRTIWSDALAAHRYSGPRVWLHGDPHPNNTVIAAPSGPSGPFGLSGVGTGTGQPMLVDFGDLCAGDPASDLGSALLHFSPAGTSTFMNAYDDGRGPDAALWARARGWAVYYAVIYAGQSADEPLRPLGRKALA